MIRIHKQRLRASLAITTNVGCKNSCSYCPQKSIIQAYKKFPAVTSMSFDTFIASIESVPRNVALSFSGFSEPWLNPDCTRMIIYAHKQKFKIRVNTTLIGMQPEDINQLTPVPFIKFVVHLPDNQNLTRIRVDKTYLDNLDLLFKERPMNLVWKFHQSSSELNIHPEVLEVLQRHHAPVQIFGLNNRAGKVKSGTKYIHVNKVRVLRECQDFHHNILLPNGDVTLCHMDWSLQHILGNLLAMRYSSIHSSKAYKDLLQALSQPDADILCRACEKDTVKRTLPQQLVHQLKKKINGEKNLY